MTFNDIKQNLNLFITSHEKETKCLFLLCQVEKWITKFYPFQELLQFRFHRQIVKWTLWKSWREEVPSRAASRHWAGHTRRGQHSGEVWSSHSGKQIPFWTEKNIIFAASRFKIKTKNWRLWYCWSIKVIWSRERLVHDWFIPKELWHILTQKLGSCLTGAIAKHYDT